MEKNKKGSYIIMGVLSVMILGLSIAFAALSATLNINFGNVNQTTQTWNVQFNDSAASVTASEGGTSATGRVCGTASVSATQVTVADTQLSKPGDKCTWALKVENKGSIDATLTSVTPTAPTSVSCTPSGASMVCGNITYKITTDPAGTTLLTSGGTLGNTTGTLPIYLIAEYTGDGETMSAVTQTGAKFTLLYDQA